MRNETAVCDPILAVNMQVELLIDFGSEPRSFMSRIERIYDGRIFVTLPAEDMGPIDVPDGSPVRLVVKKNGICFLSTVALETSTYAGVPVIALEATHGWQRVQRREAYRLEKPIPLDKAILVYQEGKQERIKATICNLSITGALLETSVPVPENGLVRLGFTPPGEPKPLEVSAEVVRVEFPEGGVGNASRAGVRFVDFIQGNADDVARFIFKQQMIQSRSRAR